MQPIVEGKAQYLLLMDAKGLIYQLNRKSPSFKNNLDEMIKLGKVIMRQITAGAQQGLQRSPQLVHLVNLLPNTQVPWISSSSNPIDALREMLRQSEVDMLLSIEALAAGYKKKSTAFAKTLKLPSMLDALLHLHNEGNIAATATSNIDKGLLERMVNEMQDTAQEEIARNVKRFTHGGYRSTAGRVLGREIFSQFGLVRALQGAIDENAAKAGWITTAKDRLVALPQWHLFKEGMNFMLDETLGTTPYRYFKHGDIVQDDNVALFRAQYPSGTYYWKKAALLSETWVDAIAENMEQVVATLLHEVPGFAFHQEEFQAIVDEYRDWMLDIARAPGQPYDGYDKDMNRVARNDALSPLGDGIAPARMLPVIDQARSPTTLYEDLYRGWLEAFNRMFEAASVPGMIGPGQHVLTLRLVQRDDGSQALRASIGSGAVPETEFVAQVLATARYGGMALRIRDTITDRKGRPATRTQTLLDPSWAILLEAWRLRKYDAVTDMGLFCWRNNMDLAGWTRDGGIDDIDGVLQVGDFYWFNAKRVHYKPDGTTQTVSYVLRTPVHSTQLNYAGCQVFAKSNGEPTATWEKVVDAHDEILDNKNYAPLDLILQKQTSMVTPTGDTSLWVLFQEYTETL